MSNGKGNLKGKGKGKNNGFNDWYSKGKGKAGSWNNTWQGKNQTYGMEHNENHDEQWNGQTETAVFHVCGLDAYTPKAGEPMKVASLMDFHVPKKTAKVRRTRGRKHPEPEESNKNRFEILCLDGCIESDGLVDNLEHYSSMTGKKNDHVPSPPVAAHPRVPRPRHPARHSGELKRTFCGYSEGLCGSDRQDEKEIEGYIGGFFAVDEELHGLGQPEWVSIEVVMDSGAAESVAPSDMAPWVPIKESDGSRAGRKYISASGEVLQNLGEKMVSVYTNEGMPAEATFQVADVTRPLCSIARVCDQGNTVVFTSTGGYIENGHGQRTNFERKNNVYTMQFHALDPGATSGFMRQG